MTADAVALLIAELHEGERDLTGQLRRAAHQHAADYDVRHGATHLSTWSQEHVARLAETGRRRGLELSATVDRDGSSDGDGHGDGEGVVGALREKPAKAPGRRPEPALLLLRDLRELHVSAARNHLNWEMLSQAGKALRDQELQNLVKACQPQTARQMHWATTLIKELSPQALTSLSPGEKGS